MTLKTVFDTRVERKSNLYPIYICVRHGPRTRYIHCGYTIAKQYWNGTEVKKSHRQHKVINAKIKSIISEAENYYADCLLHNKVFKIDLVGTGKTSHSFIDYLLHRSKQYDSKGQIVMARKVKRLSTELEECFGSLYFDEINPDILRTLETWQIDRGNVNNTRVKKFAKLRQFYDHAIDDQKASAPNPFKKYKILAKPVKKEKLTIAEIAAIEKLELQPGAINNARNLFLFSYYAKGVRFENCIMFRSDDIREGRVFFKSNKGNKFISVKIHPKLQAVLCVYPGAGFIFPYVKHIPQDKKDYLKVIDSTNTIVNRNLKIVAALAGITKHMSFHIARHSFANQLKENGTDIYSIQEALGHSDIKVTQVYLGSLGDEKIDEEMKRLYGD